MIELRKRNLGPITLAIYCDHCGKEITVGNPGLLKFDASLHAAEGGLRHERAVGHNLPRGTGELSASYLVVHKGECHARTGITGWTTWEMKRALCYLWAGFLPDSPDLVESFRREVGLWMTEGTW